MGFALEHRAQKWEPVLRKKRCDNKKMKTGDDFIERRLAFAAVPVPCQWEGEGRNVS
ncbi:hypothetical protein SBA_ch1_12870 [Sphingomonas bisphenolicum]|uniref:Transposase n=1 Tax=Sphingomonas bisphenolicum TaxID=296544 RepID=A0ABN5WA03_9SPHN|nr:hypothetical protein SBA_ch1_12870 [Sphingomonas bisphenolicum]